ncbi:TatD DNase family protein [Mycoplasmopsis mustelae]|uniref:TatD DNase family protein n=1 Tax=Mycoplasmopsis mustelae TaxID=171289 RepID=A0A4R7UFJ6_9BACT|nr:TatD family hydrolase [Mycoplasmopsis mustelae]TDV24474.1 TatD DNase family protein [Mycoplasmopsis mustelae]
MSKKRNKFVDAHCHVVSSYYKNPEIINEIVIAAKYNNIEFFINNGGHPNENFEVIKLAQKYPIFKACIGIHPEAGSDIKDYVEVEQLLLKYRDSVIGIGEIGIDYFYPDAPTRENQIKSFLNQIKLSDKYNLPAVIHIRDQDKQFTAYQDVYEILKQFPNLKCMLHTFAGDEFWAQKFLEFPNLYFSFSGVITYGSSKITKNVIQMLPLDRILTETDSPYLRVHPYTGEKNEPNTVVYVSYYLAGLKGVGMDKFVDRINRNLRKLFNL